MDLYLCRGTEAQLICTCADYLYLRLSRGSFFCTCTRHRFICTSAQIICTLAHIICALVRFRAPFLFLKHRYTVHLCLGTTYLYLFGFVLVPFGFVLVPAEAQLICTFSDLYLYLCFEAQVQVTCDLYLCLHAWRKCFFCACRHKLCRVTAKLCLPPSVFLALSLI